MIDLDFTAAFIANFEGFVDHVYLDAVGVETIRYGETAPEVNGTRGQRAVSRERHLAGPRAREGECPDKPSLSPIDLHRAARGHRVRLGTELHSPAQEHQPALDKYRLRRELPRRRAGTVRGGMT